MRNLFKSAGLLFVGYLLGHAAVSINVDKGNIIHDDDDKYVRVSSDKSCGWSWARVHYKNPDK